MLVANLDNTLAQRRPALRRRRRFLLRPSSLQFPITRAHVFSATSVDGAQLICTVVPRSQAGTNPVAKAPVQVVYLAFTVSLPTPQGALRVTSSPQAYLGPELSAASLRRIARLALRQIMPNMLGAL